MTIFWTLLRCELLLQVRQRAEWASLLLFFILVIVLMPFALGPEPEILRRLAPGLVWLAVLLMSLLSLDRLFVQDARDGLLDEMLTSPAPLPMLMAAKIAAQSLVMFAVLAVMVFPATLLLTMDVAVLPVMLGSFVLGIPLLAILGGIVGAVTCALRRNAALLTLLLVPFYIPVLIFAVAACDAAAQSGGAAVTQPLLLLAALLALIAPPAPFIMAAALRQGQG